MVLLYLYSVLYKNKLPYFCLQGTDTVGLFSASFLLAVAYHREIQVIVGLPSFTVDIESPHDFRHFLARNLWVNS